MEEKLNMSKDVSDSISQLFKAYYEKLVLFAEAYVGDRDTAEDMVQDVFVTVFNHWRTGDVAFHRSYLYRCVHNNCVSYLRRMNVSDPIDEKLFDAAFYTGDFDFLERENMIEKVKAAINALSDQRREILRMSFDNHLTNKEIAAATGLSVNTVKTHLRLAYADLRKALYADYIVYKNNRSKKFHDFSFTLFLYLCVLAANE